MKTKNLFLCLGVASREAWVLPALIAVLNLIPAGRVTAQTFTTLHSFTGTAGVGGLNSDGANPYAGLIANSSGNILYGTATYGGSSGYGTVFAVNTDGTGFTTLHSFTAISGPNNTNSDGAYPSAELILSGNTLYGTAGGGSSGNGTVFAVNINGTGFTNLYDFKATSTNSSGTYTNRDGASPTEMFLSGNTLYGAASSGGSSGSGTVFALNTDGTGFTNLHSFTAVSGPKYTNSEGAGPTGGLILSGNTLYGTAGSGGSSGNGTVFKLNSDGTGITNLHSFTAASAPYYTNSDGFGPRGLCLSGNTLYGTAQSGGMYWSAKFGGLSGNGTVFAVNTDGTGFRILHNFTASTQFPNLINSDGVEPRAGLIVSGNTLYGTAQQGGSSGNGTVFAVNTDGTGFTTLRSFTAMSGPYPSTNSDGAGPVAALILSGNTLYGTAQYGGSSGNGTVFAVNTDGTGFTNLHSFTATSGSFPYVTNSDGAGPVAGLITNSAGTSLYGTAGSGGSAGAGTVFVINTDGTGFTILHSFTASSYLVIGAKGKGPCQHWLKL